MARIRRIFGIFVIILGLLPAAIASSASANEPTSPQQAAHFIDDIVSRAIHALADRSIPVAEREAKVRVLLSEGLDLAMIGKFALGRFWNIASPAQRSDYAKLFHEYVLNTYASRLAAYSGEAVKVTGAQPIAETDAIVLTTIARPNGPPVSAGWRVRAEGGKFKVVDVVVEGVSMVLTQRQEFASVMQNKGLDGLLASLRAQNQAFASGGIINAASQ
jgi:phospholipid transport system substrate-binding protein